MFTPGAEPKSLSWYFQALQRRDHWISAWESFLGTYDALILPPAGSVAFPHDETDTDHHGLMSVFANLAGLPALTVPAGHDPDGLPIGVQIVGPRWSEVSLIDVAATLETAGILPRFQRPPDVEAR